MKKFYIAPSTHLSSVNMKVQMLSSSTISFGKEKTDNFDSKGNNTDDQNPWYKH